MLDATFYYSATITKAANEDIDLINKDGSEMDYAYRVYEIPGIPRNISSDNIDDIKDLLNNPNWSASIMQTEGSTEIEDSDINYKLTLQFINDQDGEDYEDEGDTRVSFIYDGIDYEKNEINDPPQDHNSDEIFDMDTIKVEARLKEVSINDDDFLANQLEDAKNKINELLEKK